MKIADFDYLLSEDLIAKRPLEDRSSSRLLVLHRNGTVVHRTFSDIVSYIDKGDMLIVNNTKVFPARLTGLKENGGSLEILLVKEQSPGVWEVLSRGRYTGTLKFSEDFSAEILNGDTARFHDPGNLFGKIWKYGNMPLPPYIKRSPDARDKETYQTTYAKKEGSIAAPTAGLHFTGELLGRIASQGSKIRELTLHVGIGTFTPIRTEDVKDHVMDTESFEIDQKLLSEIRSTKSSGHRVITVGTTTTRALEGFMSGHCEVFSQNGRIKGSTDIFIHPGYSFKACDSLITNFHLPRSTPLMLVSALCGRGKMLKAYHEAVAMRYRFLSYGDAMLIL
jgi:S-adenosylmethionine:tRNA ribosyltransferase-isomerase